MAVCGSGVFKMDIDKTKKVMVAFAEGFFSMDQGIQFCEEFKRAAKECSIYGDYVLIVDAKGVKPSTPEVTKALNDALSLYASDEFKFKKRFMVKLDSFITQSQVSRLAKDIPGFNDKVTFIGSKEEALAQV